MILRDLAAKTEEQIERTLHLVRLVPRERLSWRPPVEAGWSAGELFGHLLDCLAGFCAALYKASPERLAEMESLRALPVNQSLDAGEACARIELYARHMARGFDALDDADLARKLPTVFVPGGESLMTLLLGNLEHLINHKHQLFTLLKLMGVPVATPDLYRFRG